MTNKEWAKRAKKCKVCNKLTVHPSGVCDRHPSIHPPTPYRVGGGYSYK